MEVSVKHEKKYQQFTVSFEGEDDEAELAYALSDDGVLNFTHTFVPESARGRGIVQKLMEAALHFANENNYRTTASCPVAAKYLSRHSGR